jgi:hypothetical protein
MDYFLIPGERLLWSNNAPWEAPKSKWPLVALGIAAALVAATVFLMSTHPDWSISFLMMTITIPSTIMIVIISALWYAGIFNPIAYAVTSRRILRVQNRSRRVHITSFLLEDLKNPRSSVRLNTHLCRIRR